MRIKFLFSQEQSLHKYNQLSAHMLAQATSLAYSIALQAPISLHNSYEDQPIFN